MVYFKLFSGIFKKELSKIMKNISIQIAVRASYHCAIPFRTSLWTAKQRGSDAVLFKLNSFVVSL